MENFFNLGSFIVQAINLAIIIWILKKFVFDPYLAYLEETEEKQRQIDEAADTVASLREDAEKEANTIMSEAHQKAFEVREQAKEVAEQQATKIVADASENAEIIKKKAQSDVDSAERQLREKLKAESLHFAMEVNKKLFREKSGANADFIKQNV